MSEFQASKLQLSSLSSNDACPVKWKKPREGWVKINCDDALARGVDGGLGFIIRDEWGNGLLLRFRVSRELDEIDLLEAEAILWGLRSCIEKGCRKIEVESDSLAVISKLRKEKPWKGAFGWLLAEILKTEIVCSHVRRTGNGVAHFLADLRPQSVVCSFFLSSFSPELNSLSDDLN
ncbi:hypothetical protein V2J09_012917 [Rumex salicifolius]